MLEWHHHHHHHQWCLWLEEAAFGLTDFAWQEKPQGPRPVPTVAGMKMGSSFQGDGFLLTNCGTTKVTLKFRKECCSWVASCCVSKRWDKGIELSRFVGYWYVFDDHVLLFVWGRREECRWQWKSFDLKASGRSNKFISTCSSQAWPRHKIPLNLGKPSELLQV